MSVNKVYADENVKDHSQREYNLNSHKLLELIKLTPSSKIKKLVIEGHEIDVNVARE